MLTVAQARPSERAEFIQKTYLHLAGAVGAFILVEFLLFQTGIAGMITQFVLASRFSWLLLLGGISLLGWMSRSFASKADDVNSQYLGLGLYVVGQAIIFAPLLFIAAVVMDDPSIITTAAVLTLAMFGGLTAIAFTTKTDFTFLGGALRMAGFLAMGLIACSILFQFTLGLLFSVLMVGFASAAILYDTSKVMHHYSTRHYVAASLELFASVALLFWYILRIVMASRR
ncbi:MAG: Bax inhibitor-1 family protein [Cyanobacteria bacterium P01_F01_bin.150]